MESKLYIGNLPIKTTEKELFDFFSKIGVVLNVKIIRTMDGKTSTGRAYVLMGNPALATTAVQKYNNRFFEGSQIKVVLVHLVDSDHWHMPVIHRSKRYK